jgi:hypothetical protein
MLAGRSVELLKTYRDELIPLPVARSRRLLRNSDGLLQFNFMERFQYIVARSTRQEKIIWACGQCKKNNINAILLRNWRLIGRSPDTTIVCDVCGAGLAKG